MAAVFRYTRSTDLVYCVQGRACRNRHKHTIFNACLGQARHKGTLLLQTQSFEATPTLYNQMLLKEPAHFTD